MMFDSNIKLSDRTYHKYKKRVTQSLTEYDIIILQDINRTNGILFSY